MRTKKQLQLPKSVLDMKFMKKSKDRIEKELQNVGGPDKLNSETISDEIRHASGNFISETSLMFCDGLLEGRLSFKGMNPEIEKYMSALGKSKDEGEMEKDVSDEILAKKMDGFRKRRVESSTSKNNKIKRKRVKH